MQLEQGRASAPSPEVLTALARALRLTEAEREHLTFAWSYIPRPPAVDPPRRWKSSPRPAPASCR
ncbi:MAG TPA: helix-turn-helix transcriptional regulator [Streptosporangiaceae bacterium]|nr:helix-turn-helix transcriptional regulator [Streptosporangiaceae bacterium]